MSNVSITKNVRVFSTQGNDFTVSTSATTWGQLRTELESNISSVGDMRAIVQATKQTLELDDAAIPTQDFILFLTPKKVKSGAGKLTLTEEEIDSLPYNTIRSTASKLGLNVNGSKKTIQDRLKKVLVHGAGEPVDTTARVIEVVKEYNSLSIEEKFKELTTRVKKLVAGEYDNYILAKLEHCKTQFKELKQETTQLAVRTERVGDSIDGIIDFVEAVEVEIVKDNIVETPSNLQMSKEDLDIELYKLSQIED
jgi:hypothetical protein